MPSNLASSRSTLDEVVPAGLPRLRVMGAGVHSTPRLKHLCGYQWCTVLKGIQCKPEIPFALISYSLW